MVSSEALSTALLKAGVNNLRPAARVYLANRLTQQAANGGIYEYNLGGLRDVSFGAATATKKLATFPDIDAAAQALVRIADRAAPRAWADSHIDLGEIVLPVGLPNRIPLPVRDGVEYVSPDEAIARGAVRNDDGSWNLTTVPLGELTDFKWSYLIPGYGPYQVVKDYLGPTEESQTVFRDLVADWEGFDRLGVGDKIFGPGDPRGNLRDDVVDWRKFRDDWLAGNIPSNEVAARLNTQREAANKIRKYLADARVIDPALASSAHDKPGVDVEKSTTSLVASAKAEQGVKQFWLLDLLTRPGGTTHLPILGPVQDKTLVTAGVAGAAALLLYLYVRRPSTTVVVKQEAAK